MIILHVHFPFQSVVPAIAIHQRQLVATAGCCIIQIRFLHLTGTDIHINDIRDVGQIRGCSQAESRDFPDTAISCIDKGSPRSCIRQPMAVAVMIHGRQLATIFVIPFGQGKLVDLSTVLILGKAEFERTRIKVLVNTPAVKPVFAQTAIQIQVKLLFSEVIGVIV